MNTETERKMSLARAKFIESIKKSSSREREKVEIPIETAFSLLNYITFLEGKV